MVSSPYSLQTSLKRMIASRSSFMHSGPLTAMVSYSGTWLTLALPAFAFRWPPQRMWQCQQP